MTGSRDPIYFLCMIFISPSKTTDIIIDLHPDAQFYESTYECPSKSDRVHFLHISAFYPTKITCLAAIEKSFFLTWPRLTTELVSKYLQQSELTTTGHMKQQPKGILSTKIPTDPPFYSDLLPEEIFETKPTMFSLKYLNKLEKSTPIKLAGFHKNHVEDTNT